MEEILWKIKGFLTEPTKTFRKVKKERIGEGIKYYALLALIYSILNGAIVYNIVAFFPLMPESFAAIYRNSIIAIIILGYVVSFVVVFIASLLIHFFVWVLGGNKGYWQTLKSNLYSTTPNFLFGWIPGVNIITAIWCLILNIIGISELQEISRGRAFLAIILPILIIGVISVALGMIAYFWYLSIAEISKIY